MENKSKKGEKKKDQIFRIIHWGYTQQLCCSSTSNWNVNINVKAIGQKISNATPKVSSHHSERTDFNGITIYLGKASILYRIYAGLLKCIGKLKD